MTDAPSPLRTLIVDDEPLAVERMQIMCADQPALTLVGTASDGAAALRLIDKLEPDLVFLDISMPEIDGLSVARAVGQMAQKNQPFPPSIIFVTAFDGFALEAFDLSATDYLLKPVGADRLSRAINRVQERRRFLMRRPRKRPKQALPLNFGSPTAPSSFGLLPRILSGLMPSAITCA